MTFLFTDKDFENAKSHDKLNLKCKNCNGTFSSTKKAINFELKHKRGRLQFCTKKCFDDKQTNKNPVNCKQCNKIVLKIPSQLKRSPNTFCSSSCSATYNNTHKKFGTRRSKLEKWLEEKLIQLHPNLVFHFNRKDTINAELDIYIPSLKLAFELNGIFHYEPIYGEEKLHSTQNNDKRKFQACLEQKIELCIIDVSKETYFKEHISKKYLDIINNIINSKLLNS
jgi:hypothetical protein